MIIPSVFWRPNKDFLEELCNYLQGKKVLEIFAGNGYLASQLKGNLKVTATSRFSGYDGHENLYYPVKEMAAIEAIKKYGYSHNILLICWPTVTEDVTRAVVEWGISKEVIFIGEVTNYEKNELGGCASDSFFQLMKWHHEFKSYKGNYIEHALVGKARSFT
jgi:hypothetical protein